MENFQQICREKIGVLGIRHASVVANLGHPAPDLNKKWTQSLRATPAVTTTPRPGMFIASML